MKITPACDGLLTQAPDTQNHMELLTLMAKDSQKNSVALKGQPAQPIAALVVLILMTAFVSQLWPRN
jgi:hypothetical protein